jgi:hypothetical protein
MRGRKTVVLRRMMLLLPPASLSQPNYPQTMMLEPPSRRRVSPLSLKRAKSRLLPRGRSRRDGR